MAKTKVMTDQKKIRPRSIPSGGGTETRSKMSKPAAITGKMSGRIRAGGISWLTTAAEE
jgi:hypothetical protein